MPTEPTTARPTRARLALPLLAVAVALGAAAGCGSGTDDAHAAPHVDAATTTPATSTEVTTRDVTTVNGSVPDGLMLPLQDVTTMLDTVDANGNRLVVTRGIRLAGTRAPIHTHRYGGHTCVVSGTITDFVEGHPEPMVAPAGTCYYMPPGTLMTAANLGTEDAVLIDNFILPPGEPTITVREPGWPE